MQDLNTFLRSEEYGKVQESLSSLVPHLRANRIDYCKFNVGEGFFVYYSDVEGWEKELAHNFLNKVTLDLAKHDVKPLTISWWKVIARFSREYWRHKIAPQDFKTLEHATKAFDYLEESKTHAGFYGGSSAPVVLITPEMIDCLCDWFKYMKRLVLKK